MKKDIFTIALAILIVAIVICIELQIAVSDLPDWIKFVLLK